MPLSRRETIALMAAGALAPGQVFAQGPIVTRRDAIAAALQRRDSLAGAAAHINLLFGTAADPEVLAKDPSYASVIARECSLIVPENSLKAYVTRPSADRFDFSRADKLMDFTSTHQMAFRGHTLFSPFSVPPWVKQTITTADQARAELLAEATEPVVHFAGRVDSWDVVTEPIDPMSPNSMRACIWLQLLGPDYIGMAFTAARKADPKAVLVLNEIHLEYDVPNQEQRRQIVLGLIRDLRSKNVPIDALGLESHLGIGTRYPFNPDKFDKFLSDVHGLGLKILVTELDVVDRFGPADVGERDAAVAEMYRSYLGVVLRHPGVITIGAWGLSDRYTWLTSAGPRRDNLPVRPDAFDADLNRKSAYTAILNSLQQASPVS